ncbi:FkbM family methyltransferase [Nocardioides currus]|nr:FkbM family methyltransferase [Nocardioides currus]
MSYNGRVGAAREHVKLALRRALLTADLDLGRTPFVRRVAQTLASRGIDTVVDVGANVGQYAAMVRAAGFAGRIVSLEPLPDAFGRLSRRMRSDDDWTGHRVAAGAQPGRATIHVSANSYSSSLLPLTDLHLAADPASRTVRELEVEVVTITGLVEQEGIDPARALLKVDTQGFEAAVLDGADDLLDAFAAIQLELSWAELYTGQATGADLTERLERRGLDPWTWDAGISGADGRLLQSDTLFVRR